SPRRIAAWKFRPSPSMAYNVLNPPSPVPHWLCCAPRWLPPRSDPPSAPAHTKPALAPNRLALPPVVHPRWTCRSQRSHWCGEHRCLRNARRFPPIPTPLLLDRQRPDNHRDQSVPATAPPSPPRCPLQELSRCARKSLKPPA